MAKTRFVHPLHFVICCLMAVWTLGERSPVYGAGFEELHRFARFGAKPQGVVRGSDGNFYGVTKTGGLSGAGTLYRITKATGAVETLANFGDYVREPSEQIVVDQAGNIFGLAGITIWRWNKTVGLTAFATLSELGVTGVEGGLVMDGAGGLIGTSQSSSATGTGILWRWHRSLGARRLGTFEEAKTGLRTKAPLAIDSEDTIYGCSEPLNGEMILWRWKPATGFEKLASLPEAQLGLNALGVSVDASRQVWGITAAGGANLDGTLWRWSELNGVEKLGDFGPTVGGQKPSGPLTLGSDGYPIGISTAAIWKWTPETGLMCLSDASFDQVGDSSGAIAQDDSGVIYGASVSGLPEGGVWKWSASNGGVVLQKFHSHPNPDSDRGIVCDSQGRLYGTSSFSTQNTTVLWRWSDSQGYEVLANSGAAALSIDPADNVYGVSQAGTSPGKLWRWNETQGLVKLADLKLPADGFTGGTLVFGPQGQIYGTSNYNLDSWIWKWTPESGFSKLATFEGSLANFSSNRVRSANGAWFGAQTFNAPAYGGTLWSWSEGQGIVVHHTFPSNTGSFPRPDMAQDAAGEIYGLMDSGPARLWAWSATSGFSILATFDPARSGDSPASLAVAAFGIRGICESGGAYNLGTIWTLGPNGVLGAIHHFHPQDAGRSLNPNIATDPAGNLCGVANGSLWRYRFDTPSKPTVATGPIVRQIGDSQHVVTGTVLANEEKAVIGLNFGSNPDALGTYHQPLQASGSIPLFISYQLGDLPQRKTYFAQFFAINSNGRSDGNLVTFDLPNLSPNAVDDAVHSPSIADGPFLIDVLANDNDGGDAIHLVSIDQGTNGAATIVDNKIQYTPNTGYSGEDTLTYHVRDDYGGTASAGLTLYNSPINAVDDIVTIDANGQVVFAPQQNDSDGDNDPLTIVAVSEPRHGTVTFTSDAITYARSTDFKGLDFFTYTVSDGRGLTATANVEVRPTNIVFRRILSVGTVLHAAPGDLVVKGFGASGLLREGFMLLKAEMDGKRGQALITNERIVLVTGGPVPDLPGAIIKSIEEPAGRAVSVKYTEKEKPGNARRAILNLDPNGPPRLVLHEGEELEDGSAMVAINRFSGRNGRVFVLGKMRPTYGGTSQVLHVWQDGKVQELLRTRYDTVEGKYVKAITTLVPAPNSPADNRWVDDEGRIVTRLVLDEIGEAVVVLQAGWAPEVVAHEGDKRISYLRPFHFGLPGLCPGGTVYRSRELMVATGYPREPAWIVWGALAGSGLEKLVMEEGFVFENNRDVRFKAFADPVAGDAGEFAFMASIVAPWKSARALFWYNSALGAKGIAIEGGKTPYTRVPRFGRIKSVVYPRNATRGPLFTSTFAGSVSVWFTDATGFPRLIVCPGMKLPTPDKERTVASVRALEGANAPGLAARGFDESGRLEAFIKFTDGTELLAEFILP